MSELWWLQPGWTETCCADCGAKIWPEGDPDHGVCFSCFGRRYDEQRREQEYYEQLERERYEQPTPQEAP